MRLIWLVPTGDFIPGLNYKTEDYWDIPASRTHMQAKDDFVIASLSLSAPCMMSKSQCVLTILQRSFSRFATISGVDRHIWGQVVKWGWKKNCMGHLAAVCLCTEIIFAGTAWISRCYIPTLNQQPHAVRCRCLITSQHRTGRSLRQLNCQQQNKV